MSLGKDGISDPPEIEVRAEKGLEGCAYLEQGNHVIATEFSYIMGPLINNLKLLGYDDNNLRGAPVNFQNSLNISFFMNL